MSAFFTECKPMTIPHKPAAGDADGCECLPSRSAVSIQSTGTGQGNDKAYAVRESIILHGGLEPETVLVYLGVEGRAGKPQKFGGP